MNELLELQEQPTNPEEQLLELLDELNPLATAKLVLMLTNRLSTFHWEKVDELRENGDARDQLTAWIHDGTIWSNCAMMMKNISDLRDPE